MRESVLREKICTFARSLYERGLTHGSTGNISARLESGGILVTPTGSSFGFLDPADLTRIGEGGEVRSGPRPTKELPLHLAFYEARASASAVVHLHSCHAVALSLLPDTDADNVLPSLTAYSVMQLGRVKLLPYFMPGDPAMGESVRGIAGRHSAVLLANHGPVVAGKTLEAAVFAIEELEATARLALLTRDHAPRLLAPADVAALEERFPS